MRSFFAYFLLLLWVVLSGCSKSSQSLTHSQQWGNYQCQAVNENSRRSYQGWSTNQDDARSSALHKCQSNLSAGDSCYVVSCTG